MKYTLYLDESGDHNLIKIDNTYPIIAIVGCIFENNYYNNVGSNLIDQFKIKYWKRTDVNLESSQIRKQEGVFSFLADKHKRNEFYEDINELITHLQFTIIAGVIFKIPHKNRYKQNAINPYSLCLDFIMERFKFFLGVSNQGAIIAESRGFNENEGLKDEFNRVKRIGTYYQSGFEQIQYIRFENKKANINGLQIADLVAYPIGCRYLFPRRDRRSYNVISPKIRKSLFGAIEGYGVVILPKDYKDYQLE